MNSPHAALNNTVKTLLREVILCRRVPVYNSGNSWHAGNYNVDFCLSQLAIQGMSLAFQIDIKGEIYPKKKGDVGNHHVMI